MPQIPIGTTAPSERAADDDDEWPTQLEEIAAGGGRSKHLLEALILLNRYYEPIKQSYEEVHRLQLLEYYLITKKWSAHQIEQDLINDDVIKPRKSKSDAADAAADAADDAGGESAAAFDREWQSQMDALLQPIWDSMRELDRSNTIRHRPPVR